MRFKLGSPDDIHGCIMLGKYHVKMPGEYDITLDIVSTFVSSIEAMDVKFFFKCSRSPLDLPSQAPLPNIELGSMWAGWDSNFAINFTKTVKFTQEIYSVQLCCLVEGSGPDHQNQIVSDGFIEFCRIGGLVEGTSDPNKYVKKIIPKNHLPEVSVNDLLMSHKQMFGIGFYFDDSTAQIQLLENKDLFQTRALDLSSAFIEKATDIEISEPQSFSFKYETDEPILDGFDILPPVKSLFREDTPKPRAERKLIRVLCANAYYQSQYVDRKIEWVWYSPCFQGFSTSENNKEKIDIKASPMPMNQINKDTSLPYYDGDGVSPMFMPTVEKTDKIIYLIKKNGTTASTTSIMPSGYPYTNVLSLAFDGDDGLYEAQLKSWYEFLGNSNVYTCEFRVKVEDMLRIIELFSLQDKPINEQIRRVRLDNQEYIPEQFTFELTHTQINCKAKLRKDDRA